MIEEQAEKEITKIPISNKTISRRICSMSEDIEQQVLEHLKSGETFALLPAFVRYVWIENIVTQFLCCKELTETTTGGDVYNIINNYFEKQHFVEVLQ